MATLANKLEAVLFYRGEPETRTALADILGVSVEEVNTAAGELSAALAERGVRLLMMEDLLELVTAPETSDVVTLLRKRELTRDLGKAGAETLAIVLYQGPVSRADIEYVRGVHCAFVLRNLLIRGLIERVPNPKNARSALYRTTPRLLEHLGVTEAALLPDYEKIRGELATFRSASASEAGIATSGSV